MRDVDNDRADDISGLDEQIRRSSKHLQPPGMGPEVDYPSLYAYIDNLLPPDERKLVLDHIVTWASWHHAYCELQISLAQPDPVDDGTRLDDRPEMLPCEAGTMQYDMANKNGRIKS